MQQLAGRRPEAGLSAAATASRKEQRTTQSNITELEGFGKSLLLYYRLFLRAKNFMREVVGYQSSSDSEMIVAAEISVEAIRDGFQVVHGNVVYSQDPAS